MTPDSTTAPEDDRPRWRTEVGRFRAGQPRRRFPLGVHVGAPAGRRCSLEVPSPVGFDAGLRFDLVGALLSRWEDSAAYLWVTRPGVPELHDADLQWHAAARRAFAACGAELLGCFAVTRTGWLEVTTGEARVWKRLRL